MIIMVNEPQRIFVQKVGTSIKEDHTSIFRLRFDLEHGSVIGTICTTMYGRIYSRGVYIPRVRIKPKATTFSSVISMVISLGG